MPSFVEVLIVRAISCGCQLVPGDGSPAERLALTHGAAEGLVAAFARRRAAGKHLGRALLPYRLADSLCGPVALVIERILALCDVVVTAGVSLDEVVAN